MELNNRTVSFDNEKLILVDENDNILGYKSKAECHDGEGILHRGFSIFILNDNNQLLIQKRSSQKRLWPLCWGNSVCSHPRQNEDNGEATQRRLKEELGITVPLQFLFKFIYQARFVDRGSEYENCSVYLGKSNKQIFENTNEIAEWKFIDLELLQSKISENPENFTPWLKIELKRILRAHMNDIGNL